MNPPANLMEKLATFTDRFSPRTLATYNNNDIMVVKLEGAFHWHKHDETDDFFLVLKARSTLSCGIGRSPSMPVSFLWCPKALSIGRWHVGSAHPADRAIGHPEHGR